MQRSDYLSAESGPPHDLECEKGVLSCLLGFPSETIPEGIPQLRTENVFYDLRHRMIYEAIVDLDRANTAVALLTVRARLEETKQLEAVGGIAYLTELIDYVPVAGAMSGFIKVLRHKFLLRQAQSVARQMLGAVEEGLASDDAGEALEKMEKAVLGLNADRVDSKEVWIGDLLQGVQDTLDGYVRGAGINRGLPTGFEYLDKMICGMGPADVIVLAGRPGMGKTSFVMNVMEYVAVVKKVPAAIFSLEMTSAQLAARLLFQAARADFQRFRTGYLENSDIPELAATMAELRNSPMLVDDTPGLTITELRGRARRMKRQHGIGLVVIDYLQLLRASQRYNNREQEVADISGTIKAMAKELMIPVIVLAQLNRDAEKASRVPGLQDLRESGAIEQDADCVGILYKPKERDEDERADWSQHSVRVNMRIAKQRNGPTGDVELLFRKSSMRFESHVFSRT